MPTPELDPRYTYKASLLPYLYKAIIFEFDKIIDKVRLS